jgi:hypothetical protein
MIAPQSPKRSTIDVQAWAVHRLVDAITGAGNERIFIPSFQRSFVWKPKKQQELIESIRTSKPIGSLLFYDNGIQDGKQQYQIVDGLQRSTTLKNYQVDVFKTYTADEAEEDFITAILDALDVATEHRDERRLAEKRVRSAITTWVRARHSFESRDGFSVTLLLGTIGDHLRVENAAASLEALNLCEQYLERLRNDLEIGSYKIPVVVFGGDRALLPDIFEKLNTRGVKLNKFDILASSWSDKKVDIESTPILNSIAKRRRELEKSAIQRTFSNGRAGKVELFDSVCGFGIELSDRFQGLFARKKGWTAAEPLSCAFNLVALSFGLSLSKLEDVPGELDQWESMDDYFEGLLAACEEVAEALKSLCDGTFEASRIRYTHTELQMASLVAAIFQARYIEGTAETMSPRAVETNLPQHYLWDALRREWSGTGDTKAVRAVKEARYATAVNRSVFFESANAWHNEHLMDAYNVTKKSWMDATCVALLRAYLHASGVPLDASSRIVAEPANPSVSIIFGTANLVSNVRLLDAKGHVLADPGTALPTLSSTPTENQIRNHLRERFKVMLDKIALAYGFPQRA